ncbi:AraC family transcriptional regulator [Exiguobacterium chiriqhucha]|uniref:AraC family transcriptional regulator n=1 Tax=Exiguobacterium chiriqhucha TaxID=1385984 RepID=UPI0038BC5451
MEQFLYKKSAGITALSASLTNFTYKKHAHEEYAVGVTLRGIQHYQLDGALQLSHPSGVMLFNPEQAHDGMAHDETGLDYVMLYLDPQMFAEIIEKKDVIRFPNPVVYDSELKKRILNLSQAVLDGRDEALCTELLLPLTDSLFKQETITSYPKDDVFIEKSKELIQGNLGSVLRVDEISGKLGLSKFQFIRAFKAKTGIPPYQYFLNSKIKVAKQLIEQTHDVYMAVVECGFVDLNHLNKHFKGVFGITAFEYLSHINGRTLKSGDGILLDDCSKT